MEEQEAVASTEPSEEQVTAAFNGEQAPAEQAPEAKQQTQTAPQAAEVSDPNKLITEALEKALGPIRSELGQYRKMRSEFSRQQQGQQAGPVIPKSWADLPPDQQAATRELVKHIFESEYGEKWNGVNGYIEQMQTQAELQGVYGKAQEYAGENFKELDPIMGRLFTEFAQKAKAGDEESAQIVQEIRGTTTGLRWFVDLAKQEYAKTVQAQAAQSQSKQAETRKRVGTALGNTNTAPISSDAELAKINAIKDPTKRYEAAKAYWQERGEIQ
jgi:hypothetical protein